MQLNIMQCKMVLLFSILSVKQAIFNFPFLLLIQGKLIFLNTSSQFLFVEICKYYYSVKSAYSPQVNGFGEFWSFVRMSKLQTMLRRQKH